MEGFFTVWLFVVGLCVGSFLNVVIARLPEGQSLVRPGSRCPKCGQALRWYENVPVLSFVALRGRCSSCRAPISWRYPTVELLTGLLFLAGVLHFGWTMELVGALVLVALLVALTFIDLQHWLLPFELTLPGIALGIGLSAFISMDRLRDSALGAAIGFGSFWAMEIVGERIFRKEALGGGDKYLLAMIGAFLTYRPLLGVVFLASIQGAMVGIGLIVVRGRAGPAPTGEPEQLKGEVVLEKLTGSRELQLDRLAVPPELLSAVPRTAAVEHLTVPVGRVGQVLLVASSRQPLSPETRKALGALVGAAEVEAVRAPVADVRAAVVRLYGPPELPAPEDEDDWVPGPTNMPFGPWLSVAALEVLFLSDAISSVAPDAVGWLLLGKG